MYGEKLEKLKEYSKDATGSSYLMEEAIKLMKENNYWDWSVWPMYTEVIKEVDKLLFLKHLQYKIANEPTTSQEGLLECIKDLCKYYKFKMNWNNYGYTNQSNNIEITK